MNFKTFKNIKYIFKSKGHFEVIGELNENNFSRQNLDIKGYLMSDNKVLITNGVDYSVFDIQKKEIKLKNNIKINADLCSTNNINSFNITKLNDDKVLVNWLDDKNYKTCALVYDYKNNNYKKIKGMNVYRSLYSTILLDNGDVLIIGGVENEKATDYKYYENNVAEIFDHKNNKYTLAGKSAKTSPLTPLLLKLANGNILIVSDASASKEITCGKKVVYTQFGGAQEIYDINKNKFIKNAGSRYLPNHAEPYAVLGNGEFIFCKYFTSEKSKIIAFDGVDKYFILKETNKDIKIYDKIINYNKDNIMFLGNKNLGWGTETLIYNFKKNIFKKGPNLNYPTENAALVKLNENSFLVLNGCYEISYEKRWKRRFCRNNIKHPIEIFVQDKE